MAYSYNLNTDKSISFEDFIDTVSVTIDPRDINTLIDCVEPIQRLSNNPDFLIDKVNGELNDFLEFQKHNVHSAQTIALHQGDNFYVRVNAWPKSIVENEWQDKLYANLEAHDHNFDFLTVGYFGNGYTTDIWEYDNEAIIGYQGEKVEMTFLEETSLPKGKAMIYRKSKDIHTQFPAKDYSLSINIMPFTNEVFRKEQLWFDMNQKTIRSIAASSGTGRYFILELAKYYGNNKTLNIVEEISQKHEVPYVKVRALDTLAYLTNSKEEIWKKALNSSNKMVASHAKLFLENRISF